MSNDTKNNEGLATQALGASTGSDLRGRLDGLTENAKDWLDTTCNRFGECEEYDRNPEAISECISAELITKRGKWIDVPEDVMKLVYSEGYFQHAEDYRATPKT